MMWRWRFGVLAVVGLDGTAAADTPAAVNLFTTVPTAVAVSSTVENNAILPAHLVDGKLDTAWNSHTGELVGAWIGARLPADVHVDTIKLTVGFTKIDKKWGDLFTMNPRIKRVRVTRDGKQIADRTLNPELRALQEIPVDGPGGTYVVEVVEIVLGSRKDWREINVSEFEIWGKPGKSAATTKQTPTVHVGGFDHDDLTRAQCVAALFENPKGVKVTNFQTFDFSGDLSICRVDQPSETEPGPDSEGRVTSSVTVGIVKRGARIARVAKLPAFTAVVTKGEMQMGQSQLTRTITLSTVQLTTTETALEVDDKESEVGMSYGSEKTRVQLYRIAAGWTKILEFESSNSGSTNGGSSDMCTLVDIQPAARLPAELEVNCTEKHEGYPGDPNHVDTETQRTDRYKWNGKLYEKVESH